MPGCKRVWTFIRKDLPGTKADRTSTGRSVINQNFHDASSNFRFNFVEQLHIASMMHSTFSGFDFITDIHKYRFVGEKEVVESSDLSNFNSDVFWFICIFAFFSRGAVAADAAGIGATGAGAWMTWCATGAEQHMQEHRVLSWWWF